MIAAKSINELSERYIDLEQGILTKNDSDEYFEQSILYIITICKDEIAKSEQELEEKRRILDLFSSIYQKFGESEQETKISDNKIIRPLLIKEVEATYTNVEKVSNKIFATQCAKCMEERETLRRSTIPISYVIFLCITLSSACIFGFMFFLSIIRGIFIINMWYSCALFISSATLVITDIAAVWEWRKLTSEREDTRSNH